MSTAQTTHATDLSPTVRDPYLYAYGQYAYLAEFKASAGAPDVVAVVSRYASACPGAGTPGDVDCALRILQCKLKVAYSFVRFDEGYRCVVPQPLLGAAATAKARCTKLANAP